MKDAFDLIKEIDIKKCKNQSDYRDIVCQIVYMTKAKEQEKYFKKSVDFLKSLWVFTETVKTQDSEDMKVSLKYIGTKTENLLDEIFYNKSEKEINDD